MAPQRDNDDDALTQLDIERGRNDQKLKSRFEHIFRKYERDFTGVGDEFDIHTDELVVNNGHLEHMRNEVDSGKSASSRFVKNFREKLAHEDESTSEDEEETEGEDSQDGSGPESESENQSVAESTRDSSRRGLSLRDYSVPAPAHNASRPPPRLPHLMQLLAGEGTHHRPLEIPDDDSSETSSVYETASSVATPSFMLDESRGLRRSPTVESHARGKRPVADDETVHALGMSIANQLAKLMGASSKKKKSKKKPATVRRAADPIWDYPELRPSSKSKRKRDVSPPPQPLSSSPNAPSPGTPSLWAIPNPEQRKRRRRTETPALDKTAPVRRFGSAKNSGEAKRCWNCSLTRSSSWHKGPHDQDLCQSCWQYYDHHGRMKGFDSVTPPAVHSKPPDRNENIASPKSGSVPEQTLVSEHDFVTNESLVPKRPPSSQRTPLAENTPIPDLTNTATESNVLLVKEHAHIYTDPQPPSTHQVPAVENGIHLSEQPATQPTTYAANTSRPIAWTPPGLINNKWSTEDDALLIRLKEYDRLSWVAIAQHFPPRSVQNVQKNYSSKLKGKDCPGRVLFNARLQSNEYPNMSPDVQWTAQQDEDLLAYREDDELEWEEIAERLPGRSPDAVQRRYELLAGDKTDMHDAVEESDSGEQKALKRASRSYTAEEDALLVRLREVDRLSWQKIAKRFHNRTQGALQHHYSQLRAGARLGHEAHSADPYSHGDDDAAPMSMVRNEEAGPQSIASNVPSSSRRSRHSLPTVMPSTNHRPSNALLRQALGNSHRRRSYMTAHPDPVEIQQLNQPDSLPFALDPALQALSNAARPGSYPDLDENLSSAASLQLEREMQQAHQSSPTINAVARRQGADARLEQAHVSALNTQPKKTKVSGRLAAPATETSNSTNGLSHPPGNRAIPHDIEHVIPAITTAVPPDGQADEAPRAWMADTISASRVTARKESAAKANDATLSEVEEDSQGRRHSRKKRARATTLVHDSGDAHESDVEVARDTSQPLLSENSADYSRPPDISWANMVEMAFESTDKTTLSNTDIFQWIEANYPYYSTAPRAWKDRVREELRVNPTYEVDTARPRNNVWRIKVSQEDKRKELIEQPAGNTTSNGSATQDPDNMLETAEEDNDGIVVATPSQQTAGSSSRRVTFSPIVTVSTPVPTVRNRPRARPSKQGLQPVQDFEQSLKSPEIPNSEPEEDVLISDPPVLEAGSSSTEAVTSSTSRPASGSLAPARAPKIQTRKTRNSAAKSVTTKEIEPAAEKSSSSPAFMKPKAPASIYKTPRQPGWPRVARIKSLSARATKSKDTPIINHKFLTPDVHMRKRVVETPMRTLRDPEEDELAV
ncbi:hypothetical protein CB0940_04485 [Cercospora beticola]|uniref:Uncharacterized protein n=1 Tax=Cercospora beticola TaxID=122368 RepID=A0A2G5HJL7_CERBT|nr:hypothetical protein CB0940_04485 [Cercospora beticola]PIA92756.1 hypothetical protein CB0940_04485 [Cercospora beticola]WPB01729.1 hypothetical protein RHO25_006360 [Cercospora beticola]CAK1363454.1 unnamed protein product [Cercospora beticola]